MQLVTSLLEVWHITVSLYHVIVGLVENVDSHLVVMSQVSVYFATPGLVCRLACNDGLSSLVVPLSSFLWQTDLVDPFLDACAFQAFSVQQKLEHLSHRPSRLSHKRLICHEVHRYLSRHMLPVGVEAAPHGGLLSHKLSENVALLRSLNDDLLAEAFVVTSGADHVEK